MARVCRPILGFGPLGWLLLVPAAALLYCFLGGYDLRFALERWWFETFGWAGLVWVITVLQFHYDVSLWLPVLGPVSLTYILPAMFVAPRRWGWWGWSAAALWVILQPAIWWELSSGGLHTLWPRAILSNPASEAFLAVLDALAIWMVARSRWLVGVFLAVTAGAAVIEAHGASGGPVFAEWLYDAAQIAWHLVVGAALLLWAIAARRRVLREPWVCATCGYDLRGIGDGPCPECGAARAEACGRGAERIGAGP